MRTYVALLHEYLEEMDELTDEEFGRLCRGLLRYSSTGEVFEPSGNERFFMKHAFAQEDRHQKSYLEQVEKWSAAGKKAAQARWDRERELRSNAMAYNTETEIKTNTNTKTKNKTQSSPIVGKRADACLMSDAEQLRQLEREGIIGASGQTQRSGFAKERARSGMSEFLPWAETKDTEVTWT